LFVVAASEFGDEFFFFSAFVAYVNFVWLLKSLFRGRDGNVERITNLFPPFTGFFFHVG
jgi:hypothetical protein